MKTNLTTDDNLLFKWACKGLKYFLLTLLGFAIACILSAVFGAFPIMNMLLSLSVWGWFFRIAVIILCLFAIAMIIESWR
ncbi:MAG: hypothetical protein KME22_06875 [Hassallia sp. WJT32-NPBG1]|nr:hypothetical protein [Hassallia sp. WJT32-NPBG1]